MSRQEPKRLPLVIGPENRSSSTSKDSRLVNGYLEKNGEELWVVKRPGLLSYSSVTAANGYGLFYWNDSVYSIWGGTLYKDGVAITGTVDQTGGVYTFDKSRGGTPKLYFQNGKKGYTYDTTNGLVNITNANYPAALQKGSAYLDGTLYVVDANANIWGSNINDPQTWTALNVIVAQIEPDPAVALAKQLVYVCCFKEFSVEMFYDAGNATGSPLAPVQGAKVSVGCYDQETVREVAGVLFWVSKTEKGGIGVMMMESVKARSIETPAITKILQSADFTTVYAWTAKFESHTFYVLTFKVSNITIAYDVSTGMWNQWTDSSGNYLPIVASAVTTNGQTLVQHESNGKVYELSPSQYNDDGSVIVLDLYTPNFDGNTSLRKYLAMMNFIGDQVTGSSLAVRCSDDDYQTWSGFRYVDLGERLPSLSDCGTFYKRAYHFRHETNTEFRLHAVDMKLEIGAI